jgi:hypothetical protein
MAALIKELLLDYISAKVSIDTHADLSVAIKETFKTGMFTPQERHYFYLYLYGYTATEIAQRYTTFTDEVEATLYRIFTTIETISGYSDAQLMNKARQQYHKRIYKLRDLETFLQEHSQRYTTHTIDNV